MLEIWFTVSKIKYFIQDDIHTIIRWPDWGIKTDLEIFNYVFLLASCLKDTYGKEVRFTV